MRRYSQFHSTPNMIVALPSVGSAPLIIETVVPRRRRMLGLTPNNVFFLPNYGSASSPTSTRVSRLSLLGTS